jgi:diacylglycerol O-acyltransferase / wax synthase
MRRAFERLGARGRACAVASAVMDAIPLATEDRAILGLESNTVAGHTCKVIVIGGEADLAALRRSIGERLATERLLTMRLGGSPEEPAWVPASGFDIAEHVVAGSHEPLDDAGMRAAVASIFAERLDRGRPLWRIDVLPLEGGGSAIIWRIHHALADGTAAMRFAGEVLWDEAPAAALGSGKHPSQPEDDERRRGHLAGFMKREFAGAHSPSPFDGEIGTRREVAFASTPLRALHDAAKAVDGATLNDAVLSLVAGSLRHWLETVHSSLGDIRVRVPVSLHREGDDASNRDSFLSLSLPLNEPDPVARLRAVHAATTERKQEHDAEEMDRLLSGLGRISRPLAHLCDRIEASPRRFALSVSNVPGPQGPVSVLGTSVDSVHSLAEIGERHALRVAVVSAAGKLHFGFCADPAIVDDLVAMAAGVESEAEALEGAAG